MPQQYSTSKLELQGRYALHGVIESMAILKSRSPDVQRDALMLAFRCAQLKPSEGFPFLAHDRMHLVN